MREDGKLLIPNHPRHTCEATRSTPSCDTCKPTELDPRWIRVAGALPAVGLVVGIRPLKPHHVAVVLKGQDVCGQPGHVCVHEHLSDAIQSTRAGNHQSACNAFKPCQQRDARPQPKQKGLMATRFRGRPITETSRTQLSYLTCRIGNLEPI
jgi:hypothetical protein